MYDELGQPIGLCGVSTDVTEQKRLEARLEESHLLLQTVLDNVDADVYMKDADRRYILRVLVDCEMRHPRTEPRQI